MVEQTDPRVINRLAVPVKTVRVHAIVHRIMDVEKQLGRLPMASLRTTEGYDVGRTVVDALMSLEQIRHDLNNEVSS